jgi:hypothetical protein
MRVVLSSIYLVLIETECKRGFRSLFFAAAGGDETPSAPPSRRRLD